jgi:hypothetical protein
LSAACAVHGPCGSDGLTDLEEDRDRDGLINENGTSTGESNPFDADTDDDLLLDGAEPSPWEDTDEDGMINIRDWNSNEDSYNDNLQVWVVFRTNAQGGDYSGSGVWVGLIAPSANPYYPEVYDYQASVALYERDSTVTSVTGASQILNPYGPNGDERPPVPLTTPEGYAVLQKEVSGSTYDIYLQVGPTQYERFVKESSAPGDWSTANRSVQSFLKEHQESYNGRAAVAAVHGRHFVGGWAGGRPKDGRRRLPPAVLLPGSEDWYWNSHGPSIGIETRGAAERGGGDRADAGSACTGR